MTDVIDLLQKISKRLDLIENRLITLEASNRNIEASGSKLDNHIDFIESIYDQVKRPLYYLIGRETITNG